MKKSSRSVRRSRSVKRSHSNRRHKTHRGGTKNSPSQQRNTHQGPENKMPNTKAKSPGYIPGARYTHSQPNTTRGPAQGWVGKQGNN